jgi:hypothetical protein
MLIKRPLCLTKKSTDSKFYVLVYEEVTILRDEEELASFHLSSLVMFAHFSTLISLFRWLPLERRYGLGETMGIYPIDHLF